MRGRGSIGLAGLAVAAGITLAAAAPARAATAGGAVITNLAVASWEGACAGYAIAPIASATTWTSTCYVMVSGAYYTAAKDWFNVTTGSQTKVNPLVGEIIEWTVTITNVGTSPITTMNFTDTLPATWYTYVPGSENVLPAAGWTIDDSTATLKAGQSGSTIAAGGGKVLIRYRTRVKIGRAHV